MQPAIAALAAIFVAGVSTAETSAAEFVRTLAPAAQIRLPGALAEVSGLAPAGAASVYAHNDEQATIYEIDIRSGKALRSMSLGRPPLMGDFEAIVAQDGALSLVTSRGEVFSAEAGRRRRSTGYQRIDTGIEKNCEIEGVAASSDGYLLACKHAKRRLVIYEWSEADGARLLIDMKLGDAIPNPENFRATELVRDPETGSLLVLDSAAGAILEVSMKGEPIAYWRLGGDHPQAEGLALLADGRLAVADEGRMGKGSLGGGVLTIYPPRR